jgi:hypothetical protein
MSNGQEQAEPAPELSPEDLAQLVEHMQKEEIEADDARLSSLESFELWITSHPALRQMQIVNSLKEIGPAILEVVKRLLGL